MKRALTWLLAMALALSCCPALADEDDWVAYESVLGFTVLYPDFLVRIDCVPSAETGLATERFVALDTEETAGMWCRQIDDPLYPDWEDRGYRRLEADEPTVVMDVAMDVRFALYLSPDGTEMVEEIRLEAPVSTEAFPWGFDYVFDMTFPRDDPESWRYVFESIVETVEFPPQAAREGSFRLDFFQGGAAGMRFIDVIVDEEADPIVLLPLYEVTDFVLEEVTWDDETFAVSKVKTLYAAEKMGPGDNLKIFCWFSDVLPTLRVRCLNDEWGAECWYLSESGRDGSLLLLSREEAEWGGADWLDDD